MSMLGWDLVLPSIVEVAPLAIVALIASHLFGIRQSKYVPKAAST